MKITLLCTSFLIGLLVPRGDVPALTLKDAVEVIADYEIRHPEVPMQVDWYGMTDFETQRIFVIKNTDLANRRKTAIHELLHASRHINGTQIPDHAAEELAVRAETDKLYGELFAQ